MKDKILELVKQLPEIYQDVELNGEIIAKGLRNCEERWNLIKDHINPHDVVLDLGSSLGYYSKKIAQRYPDSLVISFESDPIMCEIQAKMFQEEGIYNVVLCNYRLGKYDFVKWLSHVEIFDKVLALAVLHHYLKEDVSDIIEALLVMGDLIIETPPIAEVEACGGDAKEAVSNKLSELEGEWLGDVRSHLGDYRREIHLYKYYERTRSNLDAFFGVSHPDRHRFEIKEGKINGKNIIKGINVWNLLHFNIVWPLPNWWKIQAKAAYECLEFKSDVRPWNLLVTSTGLKAIDFTTKFPEGDQAEYDPSDLNYLDEVFTEMKALWKP